MLLDYPSPENDSIRYEGINLSKEEIKKCREVCGVGVEKMKRDPEYIVELPDEPDNEEHCLAVISVDNGLMQRVSNNLSLKRHRDTTLLLEYKKEADTEAEIDGSVAKKRRQLEDTGKMQECYQISKDVIMAEEAGQSMPPMVP